MDQQISLPPHTVQQVGDFQALSQNVPWGLTKLDVPSAWTKTRGEGITILVIDTGFSGHPDNCNEAKGPSFVDSEPDAQDYNGHGSHVVGIIGACDNGQGVVGVAPKAMIISAKALDKNGQSNAINVERALKYALSIKPDIINMSLGSPTELSRSTKRLMQQLTDEGVVIVVAAGNNGSKGGVMYPARWEMTFGVGAYDIFNKIADFSAVGPEIDFVAPGVEILSTHIDGRYAIMSGTSMAAPFVTGVLALMLSHAKQNNISPRSVKEIYDRLLTKTVDLGPPGFDNQYGFGVIVPSQVFLSGTEEAIVQLPKRSAWAQFFTGLKSFFGFA